MAVRLTSIIQSPTAEIFYNFLYSFSESQFPHYVVNDSDQNKVYTGK